MSRSRKKNMAGGWTTHSSEKKDKQFWHRSFRRTNRVCAKTQILQEDEITYPTVKEKSNPWSMSKDGKTFYYTELEIRKKIDSAINEVRKVGFFYRYRSNMWLLERMCKFLSIPLTTKSIFHIKQKDIERFLQSFINMEKSK
jgi:hypothetical protein